jgi:hypothetical protein
MRRTALASSIVLVLAQTSAAPLAVAAGLAPQPHRAIYDLTLKRTSSSGSVAEAGGRLVMEWTADCDGHIVNQRILTRLVDSEGDEVLNDYQVASWESLDGARFRFNARNEINGEVIEEVSGVAELEAPGGPGSVRFSKPAGATLELPRGVTFPTEHTLAVIRAARAGDRLADIPLFDGSGPDALFHTFSVIGELERDAPEARRHNALAGVASWPVHLAYFPAVPKPDRPEGVPEFETSMRLFENGVTGDIVLDYGSFKLGGALSRLEPLPRPSC